MALKVDLRTAEDTWTLSLDGALDFAECAKFRMMLDRILLAAPHATVVDLSHLQYLDSSGLGLLLSLSKGLGSHGGRLVLVTNLTVDEVLSITHLGSVFSTAKSLDEAYQFVHPDAV